MFPPWEFGYARISEKIPLLACFGCGDGTGVETTAEEVSGFMVSSYLSIAGEDPLAWKGAIYRDRPSMVYPPELEEEVNGYIENAEERYETILHNIIKPAALEEGSPGRPGDEVGVPVR